MEGQFESLVCGRICRDWGWHGDKSLHKVTKERLSLLRAKGYLMFTIEDKEWLILRFVADIPFGWYWLQADCYVRHDYYSYNIPPIVEELISSLWIEMLDWNAGKIWVSTYLHLLILIVVLIATKFRPGKGLVLPKQTNRKHCNLLSSLHGFCDSLDGGSGRFWRAAHG